MTESSGDLFLERFLHVDMDAFYVEVERQGNPSLLRMPVVVAGLGVRGVVASASYEARAYGVRSAMPISEAKRRLPRGCYVVPHHRRYAEVSAHVFQVLHAFTPEVEGVSIDEAFLDVKRLRLHYATPADVGIAIRCRLREELGLPASVGVAATKFLAKLASEDAKPDGMLVVPAGSELEYLHPLSVCRLGGVGRETGAVLESLGIRTIRDLANTDPRVLTGRLGSVKGARLSALAQGKDDSEVGFTRDVSSISVEETYSPDLADRDAIETALLDLCTRLTDRLRRAGQAGRTVRLKLRYEDFTTVTRELTHTVPIRYATEVWDVAIELMDRTIIDHRVVRLLGLGMKNLERVATSRQLSMITDRRSQAADAAGAIREKFGSAAVLPARLVTKPSGRVEHGPKP